MRRCLVALAVLTVLASCSAEADRPLVIASRASSDTARSRATQGTEQDCTPFACDVGTGACRSACASSDDCAAGFLCAGGGICRSAPPSPVSTGCRIHRARGTDGAAAGSVFAPIVAWLGVRRRRRRHRTSGGARR